MPRTAIDKILAAAGHGDLEGVRQLLDSGVSVNIANHLGYTPLMSAARSYRVEVVSFLLDAGAEPRHTTNDGYTALHTAVGETPSLPEKQRDCVRLLVQAGAPLDAKTESGHSALVLAAWFGCDLSVEELLAKGADSNAIDANGRNAEQLARERGHAVAADLVAASRNK